jgi:hypothetical protein
MYLNCSGEFCGSYPIFLEAGTLSNDPNAMQLQMERLYEQLLKKSPQEIDLFFG